MENCGEAHAAVVAAVSATSEAVDTLKQETSKIFDLLAVVQHDLTEALTKAQFRADSIAVLGVRVEDINHKIENGLKSSMATLSNQVQAITVCSQHRSKEREIERLGGLGGFIRVGWTKFKDQLSFIIICTVAILVVWSVAWILQKALIFHEFPAGLFKLFGLG